MNFHTTNRSALEKHPAFAGLPDVFRTSITEAIPQLSVWRNTKATLPVGQKWNEEEEKFFPVPTRWDSAMNAIVFPETIQLDRLGNVYDATTKGFLYIPNYVGYGGTLSADGRSLRLGKLHPEAQNTDTLAGNYARDVQASEAASNEQDVPADWTRPVFILDITQLKDTRLYDGAFPAYCQEARAVTGKLPANCLWGYVSDLVLGSVAPASDDSRARARVAVLEAAIAKLNKDTA